RVPDRTPVSYRPSVRVRQLSTNHDASSARSPPAVRPESRRRGITFLLPWRRTKPPQLRADAACAFRKSRLYQVGIDSLKLHYGAATQMAPSRNQVIEARLGCEQPFFQARPRRLLEPLPFLDRDQNGGLNSAAGDHLRS